MTLQRLVLEFKGSEVILRVLYRRSLEDAPGPSTKRREREVQDLVRAGLHEALEALEGVWGGSHLAIRPARTFQAKPGGGV